MGWNTKRVDVSWWHSQIHAGIEFRKRCAHEERWGDWRAYYRGNWADGILPMNFFFMLLRALVPRVHFRNPAISISPAKPGIMNAVFARLLERIDNKLIIQMGLKKAIKKMIQDAFLFGTGPGKLGYGATYTPSPGAEGTEAPVHPRWGKVEYNAKIRANMPWFRRLPTGHLIVPKDCEDIDDAMWVAHEVERPIEDVKDDPRFKNTKDLVPTRKDKIVSGMQAFTKYNTIDTIKLYEIRDRKWDRIIVISKDHDKVLYEGPDDLQTDEGFPIFSLVFNNDDEYFWGVPDSMIVEPQQLEMNEIRTQMMRHRRLTLIKIMAEEGVITNAEATKMVSETVCGVVTVKDITKVKPLQVAGIPSDLVQVAELTHADVREAVGFSRNQMGEMQPKSGDTTATEASIVQMASEIRVDERRDIVSDMLVSVIKSMHEIIFNHWGGEQIIDVIGPGGIPLWVSFSGEMLRGGAYEVSVDADTAMPQTRTARYQKAIQTYQILKENPLIDPMKLTSYLLRELHGVQYDDMMRGIPMGAGTSQPMNPGQYGQLLMNASRLGLPAPDQAVGGE